jgi:hypothetical protein
MLTCLSVLRIGLFVEVILCDIDKKKNKISILCAENSQMTRDEFSEVRKISHKEANIFMKLIQFMTEESKKKPE